MDRGCDLHSCEVTVAGNARTPGPSAAGHTSARKAWRTSYASCKGLPLTNGRHISTLVYAFGQMLLVHGLEGHAPHLFKAALTRDPLRLEKIPRPDRTAQNHRSEYHPISQGKRVWNVPPSKPDASESYQFPAHAALQEPGMPSPRSHRKRACSKFQARKCAADPGPSLSVANHACRALRA